MALTLRLVQPIELHAVWPVIVEHIEQCMDRDPDQPWIADIYAAIKYGQAFLYMLYAEDGAYVGLVLTNIVANSFSGDRNFNIWYLNCHEGMNVMADTLPQLEDIARNAECEKIIFSGVRPGFESWGSKLGFKLSEIRLEKDL